MSIFKLTVLFIKILVSLLSLVIGYISYMTIITIYELSLTLVK